MILALFIAQVLSLNIFPKPHRIQNNIVDQYININEIALNYAGVKNFKFLDSIVNLYNDKIKKINSKFDFLILINLKIENENIDYNFDKDDELYKMQIYSKKIDIYCKKYVGFIRALETLFQIIQQFNLYNKQQQENEQKILIDIEDAPSFQHRGLMLDTSRTFFEIEDIQKLIDTMQMSKLNVLHLHLSDGDSFRMEIKKFNLHYKKFYSQEQMKQLINYAQIRGVRIIPEIDTPSHTYSWSQQTLTDINYCTSQEHQNNWQKYCQTPPCGQLDITQESTFQTVDSILQEIQTIFKDDLIHLGGDEVNEICYFEDSKFQNWAQQQNITNLHDAELYYRNKLSKLVQKKQIYWGYTIQNIAQEYPDNSIIQLWSNQETAKKDVNLNQFKVTCKDTQQFIISYNDFLYLDCGFGSLTGDDSWCGKMSNWKHIYQNLDLGLNNCNVIGGEAQIWSELMNPNNFLQRIWSRTGAMAERLWNNQKDSIQTLAKRLIQFEKRLDLENIPYSPITSQWCENNINVCII